MNLARRSNVNAHRPVSRDAKALRSGARLCERAPLRKAFASRITKSAHWLLVPALFTLAADGPNGSRPKADANILRQTAMNSGGSVERGKAMFAAESTKCAACHKVGGKGGDVGPDLSQIGGKFDRTHLIESILDPSAEITQGYYATVVTTKAGRSLTGIVKTESATAV